MSGALAAILTELENCTLAVVRQLQPCSTYQVRRAFARTPTAAWSNSAGTIYPVIDRLLQLKLIMAKLRPGDARARRDLSVTRKGEAAIRRWIVELDAGTAAPTPDPIRTRLHFLQLLKSAGERTAFLAYAEELTLRAIGETRAFLKLERQNSEFDYLASVGGLYGLEARLKWLRMVRRQLAARR